MNWEAIIAIGGATIVLGIVLLIPGLMWARRAARAKGNAPIVTRTGFAFTAVFISVLLVGPTAPLWGPNTAFGQWMSHSTNRFFFVASTFAAAVAVEWLLKRFGIRIAILPRRNDA